MSVTLNASFQLTGDKALAVQLRIENAGAADILVLDRLWDLRGGEKVLDGEYVYRFERGGSLRVLLGPAPLPRLKSALYRNVPLATRVPAQAALEREIRLASPLKEYSVYFPELDPQRYEPAVVSTVHLVVDYLVDRPELVKRASPLDPSAIELENPVFALAEAKRLAQSGPVGALEVARRTDEFDRLTLPGEAPEPLPLGA